MNDVRTLLERGYADATPPPDGFERMLRRRDRKRRNQRIVAGAVGIAVFVAAVWIVTNGLSFDRSGTAIAPGGAETGPVETNGEPPKSAVGPVPEADYLIDLDSGEMTPLPKSIVGYGVGEYAASPDGSRLAYTASGDNGEYQVFIANLDGTAVEQVTHDVDQAFSPAWSPDGSKIAYIGWHDRDGGPADYRRDVFVLDLATGESTQLTFATREPDPAVPDWHPSRAFVPSFTPDGASIVYGTSRCDARCEDELRMVPVAGGESVQVDRPFDAALSPDGSLLAYAWPTGTRNCVCVSNADGTGERVLVPGGGDAINGTAWSPDGTRIAYNTFHAQDVFVLDLATGQSIHVAEGFGPVWLNDHTLIIEMLAKCYDPATEARVAQGCGG
jgi:WD40 repeat protein